MQLSFSFPTSVDIYDVRNFIVHDGNRDIFDFITSSLFLNSNVYLLTGLKGSGKTYICNIWNKLKGVEFLSAEIFKKGVDEYVGCLHDLIKSNGKYILEDLENLEISEEYLLYLINIIVEKNAILLITSCKYLNEYEFSIPDLESRFNNIFNFVIRELNDDSKEKILLKILSDKQMNIDGNTLSYISKKISGNCSEILKFVNNLEILVQTNKLKKITINAVKPLLS